MPYEAGVIDTVLTVPVPERTIDKTLFKHVNVNVSFSVILSKPDKPVDVRYFHFIFAATVPNDKTATVMNVDDPVLKFIARLS
jgi:hypothetical protein